MMMQILELVGATVLFSALIFIKELGRLFASLLGFGGLALIIFSYIMRYDARVDRERRTITFVGTAVEVQEEWTKTNECLQPFKLRGYSEVPLPYAFEIKCDGYNRHFLQTGDVVRVKFVAPKKSEVKAEVLEFLNLTWEVSKHSISSPAKAPPAN